MPRIFPHPFSRAYWKTAAAEFRSTKTLVFAALMIALRIIFKGLSIPIGMDLRINTAFVINAFGAMVFGPVVAIAAAAITDTLGCLLFPTGPYFFPFIFQEIAGSLIFALFLYRADLTPGRVILSRFCINFFVNIVLSTPLMMLYYQMVLGRYYAPFDALRIIKNLVLFPVESVILILFLALTVPRVRSLGFVLGSTENLRLHGKSLGALMAFLAAGCLAVGGYTYYAYEHTSLSAGYSANERYDRNLAMTELVLSRRPELSSPGPVIAVIESAYPQVLSRETSYTVSVYLVDSAALTARVLEETGDASEENLAAALHAMQGYSKSPAGRDTALSRLGTAQIVLAPDGDCVSYTDDISQAPSP